MTRKNSVKRTPAFLLALLVTVALLGAACGGSSKKSSGTTFPSVPAGSTMAKLQAKGKIVVGTKFDQPGLGFKDPTTGGDPVGFDVEIAKLIAKRIFGSNISGRVQFKETPSAVREIAIQNSDVDIVVATYTINDARKKSVAFAGPYFVSQQDVMVRSDDNSIKSVTDLNNKKVCSVQGSTSLKNLTAAGNAPRADTSITFRTYGECAAALSDKRVQAVTTDNSILFGLVKSSSGAFKVINAPFTTEPYGIGLKKGDPVFRNFINDVLEDIVRTGEYKTAFDNTLAAQLGVPYKAPPPVDRYTETAEVVPVTTTVAGGASTSSTSTSSTSGATTSTSAGGTTSTT